MKLPEDVLIKDAASILYIDDDGNRWRLPMAHQDYAGHALGNYRVAREVATERDLFNAAGIFYELPARNAGGFTKVRAVTTHDSKVHDFGSYRGLWVASGVNPEADAANDPHLIRSSDGKASLWVGAIDDLWEMGKAVGVGGPWKDTSVQAGVPSDPFLMSGFDRKQLTLKTSEPASVRVEVDITGKGDWEPYLTFRTEKDKSQYYAFPDAFSAYWVRFVSDRDCVASATLTYQ